jgi:hypothetical protein
MAAVNPGTNAANVLDFANAEDTKFYHRAIKGLDDELKYDLSPMELRTFLDNVSQRCTLYGLDGVLTVVTAATPAGEYLIDNYGKITMAECTASATIYFTAPLARPAQNSTMLYHFLYSSLTKSALTKINLRKASFTVNNHKDGLCFLKAIITEAHIDTVGTVEQYRKQLNHLPTKMVELSGNIIAFHQHVTTVTNALDSYGKDYPELILHLFEAYEKVEDHQFATYIMVTRFGYVANPDAYEARPLMQGVENLYKTRTQAGTWQPALAKQQISDLAALTAKIEAMVVNNNQGKKDRSKDQKNDPKHAWKYVVPKPGDPKTKEVGGRQYYWCPKHEYFTMHKPEECRGPNYKPNGGTNANATIHANAATVAGSNQQEVDTKTPLVKVNDALRAYIESTDDRLS